MDALVPFTVSFLLVTARDRYIDVMRTWDGAGVQFLVSYELLNPALHRLTEDEIASFEGEIRVFEHHFDDYGGVCPVWNGLATLAENECIAVIADDLWNVTPNWRELVIERIPNFTRDAWAVVGDDHLRLRGLTTWERGLAGHPFLSRKYYELFGYVWYPGYASQGCDSEFYKVGSGIGRLVYIPEWKYENRHCVAGECERDEHYDRTWGMFAQGRALSTDTKRIERIIRDTRTKLQ